MVETFTPAVCGSRSRQRLALALFSLGALAGSAALGAALGALGSQVGSRPALVAAATLAFLAALRETGLVRVAVPQSRRQVPERWRSELPLPVWSGGYGVGLGVGFLTFQPVATFWVACATALALARPVPAAGCFALYGAGRAFMAVWPRRREPDGAAAVERLVGRARLVARANAAALLLALGLLVLAPAAGAAVVKVGRGFDPAADGGALARARASAGAIEVIVVPPAPDSPYSTSPADSPALDGDRLAYADQNGITVVDWRTGVTAESIPGPVSDPALDWPLLAYLRTDASSERLVLVDLTDPTLAETRIAVTKKPNDLGRPSLRSGVLAWHRIRHRDSAIFVYDVASGARRRLVQSSTWLEANPSVRWKRVVWVEQRSRASFLRLRRLDRRGVRTIARLHGRKTFLWTTSLSGRTAYVTRWTPSTGRAVVLRVGF